MTQFNFEIKQAKKLKKLRRKIALKAMKALLKQSVTSWEKDGVNDEYKSEPVYRMKFISCDDGDINYLVKDAFSIADEFIKQESQKEDTQ